MSDEMWYLIEQQAKQLTELSARINRSDEVDKQYAALRIEELERDLEECQKAKNVLLEALEGAKWEELRWGRRKAWVLMRRSYLKRL